MNKILIPNKIIFADLQSSMHPPAVQKFIKEEIAAPSEIAVQNTNFQIQKATDLNLDYETVRNVPQPQSQQSTRGQGLAFLQLLQEAPKSRINVPKTYKRKSMDGWMPLVSASYIGPNQKALTQQYKEFYAKNQLSKGAFYSPYKEALQFSASSNAPRIVSSGTDFQIQKAIPEMNFFTQNHAMIDGKQSVASQGVGDESLSSQTRALSGGIPNISQIRAYGSTPQISALLRERFRVSQSQAANSNGNVGGKTPFPPGGLALRSLAQAVRNGAFSLENDIIPSSASEKPQELEIAIPHRFKMRKTKIIGGYSSVSAQGTQQATAASITEPAYGVPTASYGAPTASYGVPSPSYGVQPQEQSSKYGVPPRISANAFTPGLRDYGEGVKYALKGGIQLVETQPAPGYGSAPSTLLGGGSLNELSHQLEQRLRKLVQMEVLMQTMQAQQQRQQQYGTPAPQYGAPPTKQEYGPPPSKQQYGAPEEPSSQYGSPDQLENHEPSSEYGVSPQEEGGYGVPGEPAGEPLDSYGPGPDSSPGAEYGPPPPSSEYGVSSDDGGHHEEHHEKPKTKPFTLNLNFDTGFWGDPHASIDVDGGHGGGDDHSHGHDEHQVYVEDHHDEGPSFKEEVIEKVATLGKHLFHTALDFSRVYNPITFLEKVKEFPPIRFELYDLPKGKGHKKGHKKGKGHHHHQNHGHHKKGHRHHKKGHHHGHHKKGWGKGRRHH